MTKQTPANPRLMLAIAALVASLPPSLLHAAGTEVFRDDFNTTSFDTSKWSLASWTTPQDRTQWGPSPFTPTVQSGYATLKLDTYNPSNPGVTLKGTEILARTPFSLNAGMEFEARLRTNTTTPGIITAFYTYGSHGTNNSLSDETDFEFASKDNSPHPAAGDMAYLTNWNDWSSGSSSSDTTKHSSTHPNIPGLNVNAFNTLLIRWLPDRTEWYVNDALVRSTTQAVPDDPMNLIFNIWAPDSSWSSAYSSSLKPVSTLSANTTHTMDLDYVVVRQIPANTWTSPSPAATWSTSSNWNAPSAPTGPGKSINFLDIPSSPTTITLDSPKTAGSLTFDSPHSYTLTGSPLTLDVTTGSATLTANTGSHTIASPVTLNDNTTANVAAGATLSLTTSLTGPSATLTKSTGTGTLRLAPFTLSSLTITAGTVQLIPDSPTTSKLTTLNTTTGALDLTNNALAIDYTSTSPINTIRIRLNQGRTPSGTWTATSGILSSSAASDPQKITAIGYIEASLLSPEAASLLAGGLSLDSTTLLLKYTYYGDANLDGTVDADDYALLDRGFRKRSTGWSNGDFNYDNTVDSNDYLLIDRAFLLSNQTQNLTPDFLSQRESQFGAPYVSTLLSAVPEPSSLLAACGLAIPLTLNRKRS